MDKKNLAIYISGGVAAFLVIIITVILILNMRNEPLSISTTLLTNGMAIPLLADYCEIEREDVSDYITKKDVQEAYLSLLDNSADIVFAPSVDDETENWLRLNNVEIEKRLIARDALVFVNNINNPIDGLTSEQIRGIYSGQYKDWAEVGGNSGEIIAYPGLERSEEIFMMDKFMGNKPLTRSRYELESPTLDRLKEATSKYLDTRDRALFYTTYHNMKNNDNNDLRVLTIEDIEVSDNTIKSEIYPGVTEIYAIIRADEPEDSQTRKFVEYITSINGQAIIEQCGYVNLIK